MIVTGKQLRQGRAGTLLLSAYTVAVPWTGQKLREARARRGWTQDDLVRELGASKRSIVAWEAEESTPQAKWRLKLNDLFDEDGDLDPLPERAQPNDEVDLSYVDDLHLLAEVARRMAARNRQTGNQAHLPRLRWARDRLPSAQEPNERATQPDTEDGPGVTSTR